jgi:flavin reductase (DIM6/NTAB) family NADH-FMN oxidoreductase RutF
MSEAATYLPDKTDEIEPQFRSLMRRLAGGVSIVTAGRGDDITGMTVTSLTSLSASPPRVLVSIGRQASSFALIERHQLFGINILGADQQQLAEQFSDGKLKGKHQFEGTTWAHGPSGIPLLSKSLAVAECEVEEIIERYSHGIIVGRLLTVKFAQHLSGLIYWNGKYVEVDHDPDLDRLAEIGIPLARVR